MNKYENHVYLIPEDDADRQIANGFVDHPQIRDARIKVMSPAGGWRGVLQTFQAEYVRLLRDYPKGHVVMLIDYDGRFEARRAEFEQATPEGIRARVFVVGSKTEPERLKNELGKHYEEIGFSLAAECAAGVAELWSHDHLRHNDADRLRMIQTIRPFLF